MSTEDNDTQDQTGPEDNQSEERSLATVRVGADVEQGTAPSQLGAARYVLAGFFVGAIAVSYVVGRTLSTGWNKIAESQWALDKIPWITRFAEEERATWGTVAGGVVGLIVLVYVYRRQDIRAWVNDAAAEMAKVTWPTKKEVTRSTLVVIVASIVATVYLALLDRFWGFVTNLVYGA